MRKRARRSRVCPAGPARPLMAWPRSAHRDAADRPAPAARCSSALAPPSPGSSRRVCSARAVPGAAQSSTRDARLLFLRLERCRPERVVVPIFQRHGHQFRPAVDYNMAEELQSVGGRGVLTLFLGWRLDVGELRAECVVEVVRTKATGMDRT